MMAELVENAPDGKVSGPIIYLGVISCKIYSKIETIKKCRRYKVIRYCGKKY